MATKRTLISWRIGIFSAVTCLLLLVSTLSVAGAQQTAAGNRVTSPAKAYAPSGSVKLVNHGVVDLRKQPTIKAGTLAPTPNRPIGDVKTPEQRAAYEAAVRNGSIKLPSATQTLTVNDAAAQSPSFVGGGTNPLLVKNFDGLNSTQSACGNGACPPDQAIATDLSYVMEGVNNSIAIYNANTGALQYGPYSADSFFAPVKKTGDVFYNPQMNYDVMRDRWVVLFLETKSDNSVSYLDLAVSQTNSPTQPSPGAQYNVYQFAANFQGAGSYCDYPTLGIDYYGLYASCVMYNNTSGFIGNTIVAFDKTNIYNGGSTAMSYHWNNAVTIADGLTPAFRLSPATTEGVQDAEFLVATDAGYGSSSNITLCAWTGTSNIHTTAPTLTCDQNKLALGYADPIGARQPGTSFTISPGYGPKQVYYKAGHLFLAQTTGTAFSGPADGIFLAEIQPRLTTQAAHNPQWVNGFNVILNVILLYSGYDNYMPTLMGTDEDDVLLVNNVSNSSVNPSIIYTGRKASDPGSIFGQGQSVLMTLGSDINTSGWWGEYSACAVPLNSVTRGGIWCGGEYMGSQANPGWNTRLYRIRME